MIPTPLNISRALATPPARGTRRNGPTIPPNMRARMADAEARAWAHSTLAGALWELGTRATLAISVAEKYFASRQEKPCTVKNNTSISPRSHHGCTAPAEPATIEKIEIMNILTIPQKQSNTGSIHDLNSDMMAREIKVPANTTHILILAAYYGGRGYTTHGSAEAAAKQAKRFKKDNMSFMAFSSDGKNLDFDGFDFLPGRSELDLA